jgi:hypothetical protein
MLAMKNSNQIKNSVLYRGWYSGEGKGGHKERVKEVLRMKIER